MHSKHLKHLILVAAVHLRALCTECTAQTKALSIQCKAGSAHSVLSACTVCGVAAAVVRSLVLKLTAAQRVCATVAGRPGSKIDTLDTPLIHVLR